MCPNSEPSMQPTQSNNVPKDVCAPGQYMTPPGICEACPGGSYSIGGPCVLCPAGLFSEVGASVCASCFAGYWSGGFSQVCSACPMGWFSPMSGKYHFLPFCFDEIECIDYEFNEYTYVSRYF